jgi:thiol-disulfide isomerase/thioredoxin
MSSKLFDKGNPGHLLVGGGILLTLIIAFVLGSGGAGKNDTSGQRDAGRQAGSPPAMAGTKIDRTKTSARTRAYVRPEGPLPNPLAEPGRLRRLATRTMRRFRFRAHPGKPVELNLLDGEGAKHSLAEWRGTSFLLSFWAPWCEACRRELPSMQDMKRILSRQNFDVILVNIDDNGDKGSRFLKEIGVTGLTEMNDPQKSAFKEMVAAGIPTSILFDCHGRELGRISGSALWYADAAILLVKAMMRGSGCFDARRDRL